MDYVPVFIANGFYKNRTEFKHQHVVYNTFTKFPKVDRYINQGRLTRQRSQILVAMPYERHTRRRIVEVPLVYDKVMLDRVIKDRWHVYEERPLRDIAEMFLVMRRVVNSDPSRLEMVCELWKKHPKLIVFYNFNFELESLRSLKDYYQLFDPETGTPTKTENPGSGNTISMPTYIDGSSGVSSSFELSTSSGKKSRDSEAQATDSRDTRGVMARGNTRVETAPTSDSRGLAEWTKNSGLPRYYENKLVSSSSSKSSTNTTAGSSSSTRMSTGIEPSAIFEIRTSGSPAESATAITVPSSSEAPTSMSSPAPTTRQSVYKSAISKSDGSEQTPSLDGSTDHVTTSIAEWNGHKHEPVPTTDRWLYLVQYTAGAEGWNCVETDAMIMYSRNYSWKVTEQAYGRIDRLNTPFSDLWYYDFMTDSAVDKAIGRSLKAKGTFNEATFASMFAA